MISNWRHACRAKNHLAKSAAAIGLAGDRGERDEDYAATKPDGGDDVALWVEFAMRYTDWCRATSYRRRRRQRQGGNDLAHPGEDHVLFAWAWHRDTGGADWPTAWDPDAPPKHVVGIDGPDVSPTLGSDGLIGRPAGGADDAAGGSIAPMDDSTPGASRDRRVRRRDLAARGPVRWAWEVSGFPSGGRSSVPRRVVRRDRPVVPPTRWGSSRPRSAVRGRGRVPQRVGRDDTPRR